MPEKNFNDLNSVATIVAICAGIWGSILSFINRDKEGFSTIRIITSFLVDMMTDMGFTMLTYFGLIGYGVDELLAVAVSGFVGHQGTRAVYLIELAIADKIGSKEMLNEIKREKK